ncbi:hypothetical protein BCR42DRAFT_423907 [Absidia repens]|uniref:Uncharacterized protein n=1 Tax=Absidia repens TaxID=90262 RepID=A0A1X2I4G9_9FUNG|nr:hypothetical protein BCR42DRAFT_423907 [Absidia repens]
MKFGISCYSQLVHQSFNDGSHYRLLSGFRSPLILVITNMPRSDYVHIIKIIPHPN